MVDGLSVDNLAGSGTCLGCGLQQEHTLRTDFLDFCLEHMASVGEPPGVQALCMKLAFRMCQFYPELSEELRRTLESMDADSYKPAVVGLIKKILSGKYR